LANHRRGGEMITVYGKEVPTEDHELVVPSQTALVIIDYQNDCCSEGGTGHKVGADIGMYKTTIPATAEFARLARQMGIPVINVQMCTLPDGKSDSPSWMRLRMRAKKNFDARNQGLWDFTLKGTWGAEFVEAVKPEPGDYIVEKFRSSAMINTNLDLILRSNGIRNVLVAGCTTEGCVESTVRDLGFYDYFPVLLSDCVGSDCRDLHEASMRVMSAYRTDVMTSSQVACIWKERFGAPKS
jgi:nicotinamidase-related amidase